MCVLSLIGPQVNSVIEMRCPSDSLSVNAVSVTIQNTHFLNNDVFLCVIFCLFCVFESLYSLVFKHVWYWAYLSLNLISLEIETNQIVLNLPGRYMMHLKTTWTPSWSPNSVRLTTPFCPCLPHRCPCKDILTFLLRHQLGLY